jgi:hypothetical protein
VSAAEVQRQSLQSFLLLPNQRVMRMPMLMEAVLNRLDGVCDGETDAHVTVRHCLETVRMVRSAK